MYFCEKRELNCLKRLILQRLIYIILMDSNNLTPLRKGVVGVQFLFVAFGATVLVPLLVGLDPSTALFTAGIGTLIFHAVTRGKVPIFLGSSFAFIAPIIKATELYGLPGALSGMVGVALVYFVMSALVKWQGVRVIERLFPPVVIGPVIILIGLSLAGTLMLNMRADEGFYRKSCTSIDGGLTWSSPQISIDQIDCKCQGSILSIGGAVFLSNAASATERINMTIKKSTDNGKNWKGQYTVYEGNSGYSDIVELSDSQIAIIYEGGEKRYTDGLAFKVVSIKSIQ